MIDPRTVPVPAQLKNFPLNKGMYLIHYTVFVDADGNPDFKVIDEKKRMHALTYDLCHLCGKSLNRPVVFIGGEKSAKTLVFMDGPMHEDCALYAVKVCPYLANPYFGDAEKLRTRGEASMQKHAQRGTVTTTYEEVEPGRPAKMALVYAERYYCAQTPSGAVVILARDINKIDYNTIPKRIEYEVPPWKKKDAANSPNS